MKQPIKLYLILLTSLFINLQTVAQINGKLIGEQFWSTSNLNVSKFQNGDPIYEAKTEAQWNKAHQDNKPAWCYYQNNAQNGVIYGKLYNRYAVNDPRGLAPKGWHIPTSDEWKELISFLQKDFKDVNAALKNKTGWKQYTIGGDEVGSDCEYCNGTGQRYSNISYKYITCAICGGAGNDRYKTKKRILSGNGTNSSGFSAKPGAGRGGGYDYDFTPYIGFEAFFWAADSWWNADKKNPSVIIIDNDKYLPDGKSDGSDKGCYVRLVQDNPEKIEKYRIAEQVKIEKVKTDSIVRAERIKNTPAFVIGKSILLDTLEVAEYDFLDDTKYLSELNWNDAKKFCESLGNGWRLPTIGELHILYLNKDKIGKISDYDYWSSTKTSDEYKIQYYKYKFNKDNSGSSYNSIDQKNKVRAVRTIK